MDNSPVWDEVLDRMDVPPGSIPYNRTDLAPPTDPADRPTNATYDRFVYLMICARNRSYVERAIAAADGCPFLIEDAFFNTLVAQAADSMARLAALVAVDDVAKWRALALRTRHAIASLWSPVEQMYLSRDVRSGELIRKRTIGGLAPLLLPPIAAAPLRREALPETARAGLRHTPGATLDARAANFSRRCYWRGPSWFNTDWLLMRGLEADNSSAADAAASAARCSSLNGSGWREYWDPLSGEPHARRTSRGTARSSYTFCS